MDRIRARLCIVTKDSTESESRRELFKDSEKELKIVLNLLDFLRFSAD